MDEILADLQQAKNLRILVLDSCRDNPFAEDLKRSLGRSRNAAFSRGLAKMENPHGTIISYATQAGRTADGGSGRDSPYTGAFLRHIQDKDNGYDAVSAFSTTGSCRDAGCEAPFGHVNEANILNSGCPIGAGWRAYPVPSVRRLG